MSWGLDRLLFEPEQLQGASPRTARKGQEMAEEGLVVGIDVAKGWLDVAIQETGESFRVDNDAIGWAELLQRLKGRRVRAVGLEPSGGYERDVKQALRKAGLPVRNVNPHKLRHFARALGRLAKNDRLDAAVIARYTADMPTREMRVDPLTEQLAELVGARRQLSDDKVSLKNQLAQVRDPVVRRIFARRLRGIEANILLLNKRLAELVASDAGLAEKDRLIQSFRAPARCSATPCWRSPRSSARRPGERSLRLPVWHPTTTIPASSAAAAASGRPGRGARRALYGGPDRLPLKSGPQGLPPAASCRRQEAEGRAHRRRPQNPHHSQCHAARRPPMEPHARLG